MAKKGKSDMPNPSSVTNRDILQRLNYLYQASVYLNGLPSTSLVPVPGPSVQAYTRKNSTRSRRRRCGTAQDLSRAYMEDAKIVGQKSMVRMDPSVKRTVCKGCSSVLVPGVTCRVRVKASASHRHSVSYICLNCKIARNIPALPIQTQIDPASEDDHSASADVDMTDMPAAAVLAKPKSRRRKGYVVRLPPLFQRDVGHVVFRGNQELNSGPTPEDTVSGL